MIVTRFAPSPTGKLTIGSVRTAYYNWLLAKNQGGKYILRIEDTDQARSTKENEKNMIDGFKWLGLDWDAGPGKDDEFGPYYQMERLDIYKKYINKLLDEGKAYYAYETSEELDQMRNEASKQKKAFVYRQIQYSKEQLAKFKEENISKVVRFKVDSKKIKINDIVKGEITFDTSQIGDFVILKSDGIATYYLANVVDDHLQNISHVTRGEEHLNNTPKQILLYEALGWDIPQFGHLSLMLNQDKSKMSKRDTGNLIVMVDNFKEEGFLQEAILNFVLLLGRHPSDEKEIFSIEEIIQEFKTERFSKSNPIYDFNRALWLNSEYLKKMSDEEFISKTIEYIKKFGDQEWQKILANTKQEYWLKLAGYIKVRIQTLKQFKDYAKYFFIKQYPSDDILYNEKMKVDKVLISNILPYIIDTLSVITDWSEENLKNTLIDFIKSKELKNGQVLWPLRAILTGVAASPGAFEMLYVLGKEESIERLKGFNN